VSEFAPKVVVFSCNWCFGTGQDPADLLNLKPGSNIRLVKTMCSGRVEPTFILQALANGADGVLVVGCHPGDCHYNSGNFKTQRRLALLNQMLGQMGIEPGRVKTAWISSEEGEAFKQGVADFVKEIARMGQLGYDKEVMKVAAAV
jgi:F420-non-reducing hydrogenase iron-sulfur subunit